MSDAAIVPETPVREGCKKNCGNEACANHASHTRRDALIKIAGSGVAASYAAAVAYPVYRYLGTPVTRAHAQGEVTVVAIPQKDLPGSGAATMLLFGSRPTMLIHHAEGHYTAFDAVCTHLGCTVRFEPENKRIYCTCHGGTYDMNTGAVVAGPPPKGLRVYKTEVKDDSVVVSRT
jgi:cytochrome b6-f complex iron-sulfur subunit